METEIPSLHEVLGRNAKRLRGDHKTEHVARHVRSYGLRWSDTSISALERGKVAPSLANMIPLALGLGDLLGRPITLSELVLHDGLVRLNEGLTVQGINLAKMLGQESVGLSPNDVTADDKLTTIQSYIDAGPTQVDTFHTLNSIHHKYGSPDNALQDRSERLVGVAEERAAEDLSMDVWLLVGTAAALWGKTFSEERDHRAGPNSNAQRRGQVTRSLKSEIAAAVEEARNGND